MYPFTLTSCAEAERSSLMLVLATGVQAFLELLLSEIIIPQWGTHLHLSVLNGKQMQL